MRTTADHGPPVTAHVVRSRVGAVVQLVGSVVLGLGPAAAVGLLLPEDREVTAVAPVGTP